MYSLSVIHKNCLLQNEEYNVILINFKSNFSFGEKQDLTHLLYFKRAFLRLFFVFLLN